MLCCKKSSCTYGLLRNKDDNTTIRGRVAEMARFFGIQTWFHKEVTQLSGGQKQLLNLASIMVLQPDILILDEPTSQLDPIAATDFYRLWAASTGNWVLPSSSVSIGWRM